MKIFSYHNEYVKKNYIIIPLNNITLCITHERICLYDLSEKEFFQNFSNVKELDLYELIFNKEYIEQKKQINNVSDIFKDNCKLCSFFKKCPMQGEINENKEKINNILKELKKIIKDN